MQYIGNNVINIPIQFKIFSSSFYYHSIDTNHIEMDDMTKSEASKNIKSNATLKQGNAKNVTFD